MLALHLSPHARLNQDREGYPRSVVVRVYQLASEDEFRAAAFDDLWPATAADSRGQTVVGGPDELIVIPGKRETHLIERKEKATHLGIAAKFREHHDDSGWRSVAPLGVWIPRCLKEAHAAPTDMNVELIDYTLRIR